MQISGIASFPDVTIKQLPLCYCVDDFARNHANCVIDVKTRNIDEVAPNQFH